MKLWGTEHTFNHPWKKVTEAAWKKYPNEHNPNVLAIDVINREISDDGRLLTTRIIGSNYNMPKLIGSILGIPEMCYAVEHSEVDVKNQTMTLKTVNYTFFGFLAVEETLVYEGNKDNPNETNLRQGAVISVKGIQFSSYFEDLLVSNFDATSKKGRTALEQVIQKIKIEKMLESVSNEIDELKNNLYELDTEFHVSEKLTALGEDLDHVSSLINSDSIHKFSSKISTEFSELISNLATELEQITQEVSNLNTSYTISKKRETLTQAVRKAGIGVTARC